MTVRQRWAVRLATGFGVGYLPASGTAATVLALPLALLLAHFPVLWQLTAVAAVSAIGVMACGAAAAALGRKDPGEIVLDEVAGILLACVLLPRGWTWLALAFLSFRLFDILKPWPIRALDRSVSGGWGIVLDDLAAGMFAWLVVQAGYRLSLVAGIQLP